MQSSQLLLKLDSVKNKIFSANKKILASLQPQNPNNPNSYYIVEDFAKQLEKTILLTYNVFIETQNSTLLDEVLFIDDIDDAENSLKNNPIATMGMDGTDKYNYQRLKVADIFKALVQNVTQIAQKLNYDDELRKYFDKIGRCIHDILSILNHVVNANLEKLFNIHKRG